MSVLLSFPSFCFGLKRFCPSIWIDAFAQGLICFGFMLPARPADLCFGSKWLHVRAGGQAASVRYPHSAVLLLSRCFGVGCSRVPMFPCAGNYLHFEYVSGAECPLFIRQMETEAGKHSNEFYDAFSKCSVIECHRNVCQKKVKGGKCHQGRYFPDEQWLCLPSCSCCLRKADAVKSPASLVFCSALLRVLCGF